MAACLHSIKPLSAFDGLSSWSWCWSWSCWLGALLGRACNCTSKALQPDAAPAASAGPAVPVLTDISNLPDADLHVDAAALSAELASLSTALSKPNRIPKRAVDVAAEAAPAPPQFHSGAGAGAGSVDAGIYPPPQRRPTAAEAGLLKPPRILMIDAAKLPPELVDQLRQAGAR